MSTFYRLLGFLRPYKRGVVVSWILASFAMAMSVLLPVLTGRAVETIDKGARHNRLHELGLRSHDRHTLLLLALAIVGVVMARWGFTYWRRMIAGRVSLGVEYDLRARLYGQLQRLELGFFDHQQTGQLMSRATVDLPAVRFFLGYGLVFILQFVLTIVLAGIVMIVINPWLGLISLAPAPFVVLISYRYGRRARPAIQEVQQRIAELTADAEENISGVRIVKSFAREPRQLERFRRSVGRTFEQAMVATRLEATYNPAIGFLPQLGIAAVLLLGGNAVIHAHLTLGQFTTFYLLLNMLVGPLRSLGVTLNLAQRATASGARIFQILDREPRLAEPPGAPPLPVGNGHVRLRDVTLRYEDPHDELNVGTYGGSQGGPPGERSDASKNGVPYARAREKRALEAEAREASPAQSGVPSPAQSGVPSPAQSGVPSPAQSGVPSPARAGVPSPARARPRRTVLHDIDLDIPAGRTVALVGATGSGKTSLVALISRLYDPVSGEVLLDGTDVRDVGLQSLRSAVAVVSDDPFLFSASVAENIAYARAAGPQSPSRRSKTPRDAPKPTSSSPGCPRAMKPRSASADCPCLVGSDSAWRSRAPCWLIRGS